MRTRLVTTLGALVGALVANACGGDAERSGVGGASGAAGSAGSSASGGSSAGGSGGSGGTGSGGATGGSAGSGGASGSSGSAGGGSGGAEAGAEGGDGAAGAGASFRVATYNAGLALGYELYVPERKPVIEKALAQEAKSLEVLCVQEYWEKQQFEDLATALGGELPYTLRPAPVPGPTACTQTELDTLFGCLAQSCASKAGGDLIECALGSCTAQVVGMQPQCLTCVHDQAVASAPPAQIYGACIPGSSGTPNETPALFGGGFDVGLLSRLPLQATEVKRLDSALVRAAVLYGKVQQNGKNLHVFCTHLGSGIGSFPYPVTGGSWQGENEAQAQAVAAYVAAKAGAEPAVLLGDLNTGPELGSLVAAWPDSFAKLTSGGFMNPFTAQDAACTLCPDNTFRADDSAPKAVDHALLRGSLTASGAERIMTELELLKVGTKWVPSHRSDHYGVAATLNVP